MVTLVVDKWLQGIVQWATDEHRHTVLFASAVLLDCLTRCVKHVEILRDEGRKDMFYLTTHSTHFIHDYMASDIW